MDWRGKKSKTRGPVITMVGILLGLGTHGILLSGLVAVQKDKSEKSQRMSLN